MPIIRPVIDISEGGWAASSGFDLWAMLDEATRSDVDYIRSRAAPTAPTVSLLSGGTSTTEAYQLEFAVFDTALPDTLSLKHNNGASVNLLTPPPAPTVSVTAGNFQNTVTVTALASHSVTIYRDGVQVSGVSPYVDSGLTAGQTYTYTATQTDVNGNVSPLSAPQTGTPTSAPQLPQTNLVADYRFTETSGQLIDVVGGHNSLSLTAVARNGSYYTSAANGTTRIPLALALEVVINGKAGGYMGALVRFAAIPAAVSQIASISAALALGLSINPRLRAGVRVAGTTTLSTPAVNLAVNTWHYLAVDYNGVDMVAILENAPQAPIARTGTLSLAGDPYIFTTESQTSPASSLDIALLHVYDASKRSELASIYEFVGSVKTGRAL